MSLFTRTLIAFTASSFVASAALAGGPGFQAGGNGPATVKEVKLALNGFDGACPSNGALITRVETTGPGNFKIRYRKAGGGKSDLITVTAVKTQNGKYVAKHVQPMTIDKTTDTKYMVESGNKISPWVAVKKNCGLAVLVPGVIAQPEKILKAQLGIKGPATTTCPAEATTQGWVFTNFEGPVQVMIARKGQSVGAPFTINAKKATNGQFIASFKRTVPITGPVDAEYRLLVGGGDGVMSNWVPLKATCKIGMPGFNLGG